VPSSSDWAASFSEVFAQPESAVQARIWATVLGDEYPAEVAPYSYTSRSELARIAREVRGRAARLGLADRVRTAEGSFGNLPLPGAGVAAVMSIDALLFAPDKRAAARELARVLRPGGRLVLTTCIRHSGIRRGPARSSNAAAISSGTGMVEPWKPRNGQNELSSAAARSSTLSSGGSMRCRTVMSVRQRAYGESSACHSGSS
jgi:SAM-dependent methyltransferase